MQSFRFHTDVALCSLTKLRKPAKMADDFITGLLISELLVEDVPSFNCLLYLHNFVSLLSSHILTSSFGQHLRISLAFLTK